MPIPEAEFVAKKTGDTGREKYAHDGAAVLDVAVQDQPRVEVPGVLDAEQMPTVPLDRGARTLIPVANSYFNRSVDQRVGGGRGQS